MTRVSPIRSKRYYMVDELSGREWEIPRWQYWIIVGSLWLLGIMVLLAVIMEAMTL